MKLKLFGPPKDEDISLSDNEKLSIIGNLNTMLKAGISILEAVKSLIEDAKGNEKRFLDVMYDDLIQGNHIHTTLARFPRSFNKVSVSVIKASEQAGTLETALADLAKNIKKEMEFNGRIKSAMVYPALVGIVFMGVLLLILVVVMPKIKTVFTNLKMDLPLPTRVLIFMSDNILQNTIPLVICAVVIITVVVILFKRYRTLVGQVFYRFPLISRLIKEIDLTNFSRNLYLLLNAGVPITTALDLAKDVVIGRNTAMLIERSRMMVLSGKKLSDGLTGQKKFLPAIMVKLIEVGEKTGSLPGAMQDISEYLDAKVSDTLKTVTVLLEPLMLIVVGILVGSMMLAIIAPIYGLISQVGGVVK